MSVIVKTPIAGDELGRFVDGIGIICASASTIVRAVLNLKVRLLSKILFAKSVVTVRMDSGLKFARSLILRTGALVVSLFISAQL